jgi:hypothetical protein
MRHRRVRAAGVGIAARCRQRRPGPPWSWCCSHPAWTARARCRSRVRGGRPAAADESIALSDQRGLVLADGGAIDLIPNSPEPAGLQAAHPSQGVRPPPSPSGPSNRCSTGPSPARVTAGRAGEGVQHRGCCGAFHRARVAPHRTSRADALVRGSPPCDCRWVGRRRPANPQLRTAQKRRQLTSERSAVRPRPCPHFFSGQHSSRRAMCRQSSLSWSDRPSQSV